MIELKNGRPLDNILKKMGPTVYHICYEVNDMEESIIELQEQEFMVVNPLAESKVLGGNVAFLFSSEIGLIELIQYPERK